MDLCPVGSWWPGWNSHSHWLLCIADFCPALSKHPLLRAYYWICLSARWTLSSLVTHDCILCFWLRDDLDVENRMRNAVKIVSRVPAVLCMKNKTLSWWGSSLRKFILYCVQHNFIMLPFLWCISLSHSSSAIYNFSCYASSRVTPIN